MKITVSVKDFRQAFGVASAYVRKGDKSFAPIYANAKLDVTPEATTLTAFDPIEGSFVRCPIVGVDCDEPGVVLLPKEQVARILGSTDDATLQLWTEGTTVHFQAAKARWRVETEDVAQFFDLAPGDSPDMIVRASELARINEQTSVCVGIDQKGWNLALVNFARDGDEIVVESADGRNITRSRAPVVDAPDTPFASQLIPGTVLARIKATFGSDPDTLLSLQFTRSHLSIQTDSGTFAAYQLNVGRFPNLAPLFDLFQTASLSAAVESGPFLRAMAQATAVVDDTMSQLGTFDFHADHFAIKSKASGKGVSAVEFPAEWEHESTSLFLCLDKLIRVAKSLGGSPFRVGFATDASGPRLLIKAANYQSVICTADPAAV